MTSTDPRIGIVVVAYNAAATLATVLDRTPTSFRPGITEVLVADDASPDGGATYLVGLGYQHRGTDLPLTVLRHERNLGYGGNQKACYRYAIDQGLDIVVMLHGDGQYAPESLPEVVAPLVEGKADAVLGSRMMIPGAARHGGMPLYKYVGNRILSATQNRLLGMHLSEFHSGYRAYSTRALAQIPFETNSDGFNFDTQIIIQLADAGQRIVEVPIPTYYGNEICYVNGIRYAKDVLADTLRYKLATMGFGTATIAAVGEEYGLKPSEASSHGILLRRMAAEPPSKVLDLGCSGGELSAGLRRQGHHVTAVDSIRIDGVDSNVDHFILANLEDGIPEEVGRGFDVVIAADVVEHVRNAELLLAHMRSTVRPGGFILTSVPNFAHWYPRVRVVTGRWGYDRRGILDRSHVRFFTRRTFERLAAESGLAVRRVDATGLPLDALSGAEHGSGARRLARAVDRVGVSVYPTLFAYQVVFELEPKER